VTPDGIPYLESLERFAVGQPRPALTPELAGPALIERYHPDQQPATRVALSVGANRGDSCQADLARALETNALIDEVDLAGARVEEVDVLIVGGGGAGCAAALSASQQGARVLVATKLRLGDSNTVMAEGGIQAAVDADDSPQTHYQDTYAGGHHSAVPELAAQMAMDGPDVIRWLIQLGMQFDLEGEDLNSNLQTRRAGGTSAPRVLSYRDYTGLEMMRVLKEAVTFEPGVEIWERNPLVELLTDEHGRCSGGVLYALDRGAYVLVRAQAVILATGGIGRLHLNGFVTSNHFGATADGLVIAYRAGARMRELDSFQYHPTGVAHPPHLAGTLISEAARSAGAELLNGRGERFIDELRGRDEVCAAIIQECAQGRGVLTGGGSAGVWLDVPSLLATSPDMLDGALSGVGHLARKCEIDPRRTPFLVYPTLHYQNGGAVIDGQGLTSIERLYCVGEMAGGIHGRNRLMGNALLDVLSFGRRAGRSAAEQVRAEGYGKITIEHLHRWQRELTRAGISLENKGPPLFPSYANFRVHSHAVAST
jgi:succinate dehydrogenase / fumarate reductase flavoprotein subunit/L-aspartate oxidase